MEIICIYYININETPSALSRENMISSHVKITWRYPANELNIFQHLKGRGHVISSVYVIGHFGKYHNTPCLSPQMVFCEVALLPLAIAHSH